MTDSIENLNLNSPHASHSQEIGKLRSRSLRLAMSTNHVHAYYAARQRSGEVQASKARPTQHRSGYRYSPYSRPTQSSPLRNPSPSPPPVGPIPKYTHRPRELDHPHLECSSYHVTSQRQPRQRYPSPRKECNNCADCPTHLRTRNNNWMNPVDQRSRPRYERPEEEEEGSLRFHSPPRQQSEVKASLATLQRRMDHFDLVLTNLVREVADYKRRTPQEMPPSRSSVLGAPVASLSVAPGADLDRLDRMMEDMLFIKRRSPSREDFRYSPDRKPTFDGRYGGR